MENNKIKEVIRYLETERIKRIMKQNNLDQLINIEFEDSKLTKDELQDLIMEQQEQM